MNTIRNIAASFTTPTSLEGPLYQGADETKGEDSPVGKGGVQAVPTSGESREAFTKSELGKGGVVRGTPSFISAVDATLKQAELGESLLDSEKSKTYSQAAKSKQGSVMESAGAGDYRAPEFSAGVSKPTKPAIPNYPLPPVPKSGIETGERSPTSSLDFLD